MNKNKLALILLIGLFLISTASALPSPQAWWRFDESSGATTVADSAGNNTGTINGSVSFAAGNFGNAANFDGSIGFADAGIGNFGLESNEFTVAFWVWLEAGGNYSQAIIAKGAAYPFLLQTYGTKLKAGVRTAASADVNYFITPGSLSYTGWNHIALTYESGSAIVYINSVKDIEQAITGNLSGLALSKSTIIGSTTAPLKGKLDDLRIYNVALTAAEVSEIYNGTPPAQTCGNNTKEGSEVCDGTDLSSQTCITQGFTGGTLTCNAGCLSFNTSQCTSSCSPPDCTDSNPCTNDSCVSGNCQHSNVNNGTPCTGGTCQNGTCTATPPSGDIFHVNANSTCISNCTGTTWANAPTTLPAILQRGATYYIASGNYGDYTFDDPESGTQLITIKKATTADHGSPIGWQASFGERQAVFTRTTGGINLLFKTGYYVFDGQVGGGPESWKSGHGFKLICTGDNDNFCIRLGISTKTPMKQPGNITIKHVDAGATSLAERHDGSFYQWASSPALGSDNLHLAYNYFHHVNVPFFIMHGNNITFENNYLGEAWSDENNHGGIFVDRGSTNVVIKNNYFSDASGTGWIDIKKNEADNWQENWEIYGNIFAVSEGDPYNSTVSFGIGHTTVGHTGPSISFHDTNPDTITSAGYTGSDISFQNNYPNPGTITSTSFNFQTAPVNSRLYVGGNAVVVGSNSNDGTYPVTGINGNTLTVSIDDKNLITEQAGATVRISTFDFQAAKGYSRFYVGRKAVVVGSTLNDGTYTVTGINGYTLTLSASDNLKNEDAGAKIAIGAGACNNFKIYNNTFANTKVNSAIQLMLGFNNVAYNNLWYNAPKSGCTGKYLTCSFNTYINSEIAYGHTAGTDSTIITTDQDPFVSWRSQNYGLKLATTTGKILSAPYNVDMLGSTRGLDGTWDRGAIEFTGTPPACILPKIVCSSVCITPACSSSTQCNDSNAQTTDACNNAGTCSAVCTHTPIVIPTCGNGRIDSGENCSTCPADANCATGMNCCSGTCQTSACTTPPNPNPPTGPGGPSGPGGPGNPSPPIIPPPIDKNIPDLTKLKAVFKQVLDLGETQIISFKDNSGNVVKDENAVLQVSMPSGEIREVKQNSTGEFVFTAEEYGKTSFAASLAGSQVSGEFTVRKPTITAIPGIPLSAKQVEKLAGKEATTNEPFFYALIIAFLTLLVLSTVISLHWLKGTTLWPLKVIVFSTAMAFAPLVASKLFELPAAVIVIIFQVGILYVIREKAKMKIPEITA